MSTKKPDKTNIVIKDGKHRPRKVMDNELFIVYDDFLPEDEYKRIYDFCRHTNYQHVNAGAVSVSSIFRIHDGFPLRSKEGYHCMADPAKWGQKPNAYPTGKTIDLVFEQMQRLAPEVEYFIRTPGKDWHYFTADLWIYQQGTSLSLHDHTENKASTGTYVYYVTPHWKMHWGGLLMVMDRRTVFNIPNIIPEGETEIKLCRESWLDNTLENAAVWEPGFAHCILPKRNRVVFLHPEAWHSITYIPPCAGENVRMSITGFFLERYFINTANIKPTGQM